ncbi:MAG: hypothetical protein ACI8QC_002313 [Planctomycetota bacterium]
MPVWYEAVEQWARDGALVLIGITQEQHPERCELYRQWKGFDFPILWDPFNLTQSKAVPRFIAIDEHGVVQSTRLNPRNFEEKFLAVEFDPPAEDVSAADAVCCFTDQHGKPSPISTLSQGGELLESVAALAARMTAEPKNARAAFHAGVAYRMRHDSDQAQAGDFQSAIDAWTQALKLDPNQYIWRRRIQQYGPRMDKPYRFYTWTKQAQADILARGETPVQLVAELTRAELAEPRGAQPKADQELVDPDPNGEINSDSSGLVSIESAVAFDTSGKKPVASVHLMLSTNAKRDVHWNHEAGPSIQVWVDAPTPRLLSAALRTDTASSEGTQQLGFEIELLPGEDSMVLPAYALYYVCEGESGTCLYLRQEFEIELRRP